MVMSVKDAVGILGLVRQPQRSEFGHAREVMPGEGRPLRAVPQVPYQGGGQVPEPRVVGQHLQVGPQVAVVVGTLLVAAGRDLDMDVRECGRGHVKRMDPGFYQLQ